MPRLRPKAWYFGLLVATVVLGIASRRFPSAFPGLVVRYGGDALWAGTVFWLLVLVRPAISTRRAAFAALGIAFFVELGQLYHAPWIDAIRKTLVGALVLGQGFLWSDLVSYAAGVALVAALDGLLAQLIAPDKPASVA